MPVLRVNVLRHGAGAAGRAAAHVIGYIVEDGKALGRRSWNFPVNDFTAATLMEYDRWRGGARDGALLHVVLSFPDGTSVSVDQAFDYFERIFRGTSLRDQPIVAAAHEGRPHVHAVISRVMPDGNLAPLRIFNMVDRERDLALEYGLGVLAPRERPIPASILNAETWEGHLAFARYMRALPWPTPSGDRATDAAALNALFKKTGVNVTRVGRGFRLHSLYGGREDRAKASICVPDALRPALEPLTVPPDNPRSYGALREAGRLVLPAIKRGERYREVQAAQERSAKGLGYWHRRLAPPPPTWTHQGEAAKGRLVERPPSKIAFQRTGDMFFDLAITAKLDITSEKVDFELIDAVRRDLDRVETTKETIEGRPVLFGRDDVALAVREAAARADQSMDWKPTTEGVPGPCRAFDLLGDVRDAARIDPAAGDREAFGDTPAVTVSEVEGRRIVTLSGSVPLMNDANFLDQVREQLGPVELAKLRQEFAIAQTDLSVQEGPGLTAEQQARARAATFNQEARDIEETFGEEPPLSVQQGLLPDLDGDDVFDHSTPRASQEGQQRQDGWSPTVDTDGKIIDGVYRFDPKVLEELGITPQADGRYAFVDRAMPPDHLSGEELAAFNADPANKRTMTVDAAALQTLIDAIDPNTPSLFREGFSYNAWIEEHAIPVDGIAQRSHDAHTIAPHEPDSTIGPATPANGQTQEADENVECTIKAATPTDHSGGNGRTGGDQEREGATPTAEATARATAQANRLLEAWAKYLADQGLNPERVNDLVAKQRSEIFSYVRLAGDLRAHAAAGREDKTTLMRTLSLLSQTTAIADFALAAAAADLHKPIYSPGEFAVAKETAPYRDGLTQHDVLLALGRGEHALPIGARAMAVAKALTNMQWVPPETDRLSGAVKEPGAWCVQEEGENDPTFFTERNDGYHFSRDQRKNGVNGIRAALLLAANEDDGAVTLTGTKAFRRQVGKLAAQMGIVVTNNRDRFSEEDSERAYRFSRAKNLGSPDPSGSEKYLQQLLEITSLGAYQEGAHIDQRLTIVDVGQKRRDGLVSTLAFDTKRQLVSALLPLPRIEEEVRGAKGQMETQTRECGAGDVVDLVFEHGTRPTVVIPPDRPVAKNFEHEREPVHGHDDRTVRSTKPPQVQTR